MHLAPASVHEPIPADRENLKKVDDTVFEVMHQEMLKIAGRDLIPRLLPSGPGRWAATVPNSGNLPVHDARLLDDHTDVTFTTSLNNAPLMVSGDIGTLQR